MLTTAEQKDQLPDLGVEKTHAENCFGVYLEAEENISMQKRGMNMKRCASVELAGDELRQDSRWDGK